MFLHINVINIVDQVQSHWINIINFNIFKTFQKNLIWLVSIYKGNKEEEIKQNVTFSQWRSTRNYVCGVDSCRIRLNRAVIIITWQFIVATVSSFVFMNEK